MKKNLRKRIVSVVLLGVLLVSLGLFAGYVDSYYRAAPEALAATVSDGTVTVTEQDGTLVFTTENPVAGLVFYPGGKVQVEAYAPLLRAIAERGVLCVLVQMPCNLAVLNGDAADAVIARHPELSDWYIGGHSLGGSMAALYAAKHASDVDGLILLAAYSTADLKGSGLSVLSLYGDTDGVMRRERYEQCRTNLPADAVELVIAGGNHAGFGCYGAQAGDGAATISAIEQQAIAADAIAQMISEGGK